MGKPLLNPIIPFPESFSNREPSRSWGRGHSPTLWCTCRHRDSAYSRYRADSPNSSQLLYSYKSAPGKVRMRTPRPTLAGANQPQEVPLRKSKLTFSSSTSLGKMIVRGMEGMASSLGPSPRGQGVLRWSFGSSVSPSRSHAPPCVDTEAVALGESVFFSRRMADVLLGSRFRSESLS